MTSNKETALASICRTCRKISSAMIFNGNFCIRGQFAGWDPNWTGVISERQFVNIMSRQLSRFVSLSEGEIKDLADYFKLADGRILYSQLCDLVEEQIPASRGEFELEAAAEKNVQRFQLTTQEKIQLREILKLVAKYMKFQRIFPCFSIQDHELVAKPKGILSNAHFLRVLTHIGVHLHPKDICLLLKRYGRDLATMQFEEFMNCVKNTMKEEEQKAESKTDPCILAACKPLQIPKNPKNFEPQLEEEIRSTLEKALDRIYRHINNTRRINLRTIFGDFDKQKHTGHVTSCQMRRVLHSIGLLLMEKEIEALECRYCTDPLAGFDYETFLNDLNRCLPVEAIYHELLCKKREVSTKEFVLKPTPDELNLSRVLCKVTDKIQNRKAYVRQFLEQFDVWKTNKIKVNDFKRGIDTCLLGISNAEMNTLAAGFSVKTPGKIEILVNYEQFLEAVTGDPPKSLENCPKCIPTTFCPGGDCWGEFLNYEERQLATDAIRRLATVPDLNLEEVFHDQDKLCTGKISLNQFYQALGRRNISHVMSPSAYQVLCKAFRTNEDEMNYRAFLQALQIAICAKPA